MSLNLYTAFVLTCVVMAVIPGPTATLIVANALRHGTGAGLKNVAGTQAGLAVMIAVAGIGLTSVIAMIGEWFDLLRYAGAAYLIYLGWKMWNAPEVDLLGGGDTAITKGPRGGFLLQGTLVALSNPKMLLFFGAFFPQFIDPARPYGPQIALMGVTSMIVAALSDGTYALLAGTLGRALSKRRLRTLTKASGACLIGGGLWLAVARR
jgi:threonine/homoserine/homoserine lactone efflux protein